MTKQILIVDNLKTDRDSLKKILIDEYSILEAENGKSGLDILENEYKNISAVLLDLNMPIMNGFDFLKKRQEFESLLNIPIIAMTSSEATFTEENALTLGAIDYITKPYNPKIIKKRIYNIIKLFESSANIEALMHDKLTGLYSRDIFFEKVGKLVSIRKNGYYIMTCLNITKFKIINDQYGLQKSDEILCNIAKIIKNGFENNGGICSRIFADKFAVLFPTALHSSPLLSEIWENLKKISGLASPLIFNIGQYIIDDKTILPFSMFDRAIIAANSIKGRYDVHIAIYDESMRSNILREQSIVNDMDKALREDEFNIWFQPQYNHITGELVGAEALSRWYHPKEGIILPKVFIPIFEKNGFIYEHDKYIWEKVCIYLREEIDSIKSPPPISVKVSYYDLLSPDFVDVITGLIKKYNLPTNILHLEITESTFIYSTDKITKIVQTLINLGFIFEIDNFGSENTSINIIKSVPAQIIKIDMRFYNKTNAPNRSGSIIESLVRMAKWLGISVIAKGVESKKQADYLKSIGCNYVQGFLYSIPIPKDDYHNLCSNSLKGKKILDVDTVKYLDNKSFWNPMSIDTLIFNSYVGAACIYELYNNKLELIRASEKYYQIFADIGIAVEDVLKTNLVEHIKKECKEKIINELNISIPLKNEITVEFIFVDLPGVTDEIYLRSSMRIIASAGNRHIVYCTNENITAQKRAEQNERELTTQLKMIMDNVNCGITAVSIQDKKLEYLSVNNRYCEILGYTKQELKAQADTDPFFALYSDDRQSVIESVENIMNFGGASTIVFRAVRKDKKIIWLHGNISMAYVKKNDIKIQFCTFIEITKQKEFEIELQNTTNQIKNMMDDIPGGFARFRLLRDKSFKVVYINMRLCNITGFDHEKLMDIYSNSTTAGVHPEDVQAVKDDIAQIIEQGEAQSSAFRLQKSNGTFVWVKIFGRITKDSSDNTFLNIYYIDATKQVKKDDYQMELLDNLPFGAAMYELDGYNISAIHLNKRYWELVNRKPKIYHGGKFINAVHPDDTQIISKELRTAIIEDRDVSCNIRILYGNNEYRPFHIVARIVENSGKFNIYATYSQISDEEICIKKYLPVALNSVMNSKTHYTFVKDKNLKYVCCSQKFIAITEKNYASDFKGKGDYEIFDKSLANNFFEDDSKILKTGEPILNTINKFILKNGTECFTCTSKFPLKDSIGNVIGIYGVGHDITKAHVLKSRFELLANCIPGGIMTLEYEKRKYSISYFSEELCRMFNLAHDEYAKLLKDNPFAGIFDEDLPKVKKQLNKLIKKNEQIDCIFRVHLKSDTYKWVNLKAQSVEESNNKFTFNAVLFDITQRQKSIERLRIREEESRLAISHSKNIVCKYVVATKTLHISPVFNKIYEKSDKLFNVPYAPVKCGRLSEDTKDAYINFFESIIRGEKFGTAVFQRKIGTEWNWVEAKFSTVFSNDGEPVSAVISYSKIEDHTHNNKSQEHIEKE